MACVLRRSARGEKRAERLQRAGNDPEGATIYVTLEPCCHYGKTPPCTEAIIEKRIVLSRLRRLGSQSGGSGERDSNSEGSGVETEGPVMEAECLEKNRIFFHYITEKTPYVIMKYAMTADGKIACVTGDSPMGDSRGSS